jgi:hypothetical protein
MTTTLKGISFKPVSKILTDWEIREALTSEHKDRQMVVDFQSSNPYTVLFSLAYALDRDDTFGALLTEDQRLSLARTVQDLAIKTGRKEGAL